MNNYWEDQKCFEFLIFNQINLRFLHLRIKPELEEQRCHKVVTVMSIEFDLLLLVSLQCSKLCFVYCWAISIHCMFFIKHIFILSNSEFFSICKSDNLFFANIDNLQFKAKFNWKVFSISDFKIFAKMAKLLKKKFSFFAGS